MKKRMMVLLVLPLAGMAFAQSGNREAFLKQQAYNEMQRISGQVDVLQSNQDDLAQRVSQVEKSRNEVESLKAEIAALRASLEQVRRELAAQRGEIVKDLSARLAKLPQASVTPARPQPTTPAYSGNYIEYVVAGGDTLTVIAKAYNTTVQKIKDMNGLKSDNLRIGQKLNIPMEK